MSKALGLLEVLTFLQYYIACYGNHQFIESLLHCFCDNPKVITTASEKLTPSIL